MSITDVLEACRIFFLLCKTKFQLFQKNTTHSRPQSWLLSSSSWLLHECFQMLWERHTQDQCPCDGGHPTGPVSHQAKSRTASKASAASPKAGRSRCWVGLHPKLASWPGPSQALRVRWAFPAGRKGLSKRRQNQRKAAEITEITRNPFIRKRC